MGNTSTRLVATSFCHVASKKGKKLYSGDTSKCLVFLKPQLFLEFCIVSGDHDDFIWEVTAGSCRWSSYFVRTSRKQMAQFSENCDCVMDDAAK